MTPLSDHFKCPICFEIPSSKIYQCKNGHTFCSECNSRLKACPQCRVILGSERIRNRTLEQILESTKFACPNKELGCSRILLRNEISSHLLYCKFEPFYFCKLIGFETCQYNAVHILHDEGQGHSQNLIDHLEAAHPEIQKTIQENSSNFWIHLNYTNLLSQANKLEKGQVAIWTPHLVKLKNSKQDDHDHQLFLVLCQISESTRNAAWICLEMTTTTDTNTATDHSKKDLIDVTRSQIKYQIKGQSTEQNRSDVDQGQAFNDDLLTPKMTWKAPLLTFKDIDKELENYALRIPICVLNSFNNAMGDLQVQFKIDAKISNRKSNGSSSLDNIINIPELTSFVTKATFGLPKPQCPSYCQRYPEDTNEDLEENSITFGDVYCDGCGQRPLTTVRYKCLQCIDYDLCKECMDRGDTHQHHVFARINSLRQNDLFNWKHRLRMMKGRLNRPTFNILNTDTTRE